MTVYRDYHKIYFERLSWIYALLEETISGRDVANILNKSFKDGVLTFIIFDNYRYFTGGVISRYKNKTVSVRCPGYLLDIEGPVHWKTKGDEYLSRIRFFTPEELEKTRSGIIMLDIRHLLRIIHSPMPLKTFVQISYNGVIYTELPDSMWFKLRMHGLFSKKNPAPRV
ncbi:MAG: hypothetical protein JXA66_07900 [Oligoflexia bacterium]|nr:hypothetical protein [Oligoflexia bacterium]